MLTSPSRPLLLTRRRTYVLALVLGAATALLASAPALGVATLIDTPAIQMANVQHSPAIAIDPDLPSLAAVAADDGTVAPPPHTATASTVDWTAGWSAPGTLPHSGSTSAGQPDLAWGIDGTTQRNVYAVELGSQSSSLCMVNAGVYLSASTDGGATYAKALPDTPPGSNLTEAVEPANVIDRPQGPESVA